MVIAPLAFAAVGAIPELIAAMSIAAAVCFTTSPASLESSIVSKLSNVPVAEYVSMMKIFALVFTILAIALGYYGARKRKVIFKEDHEDEFAREIPGCISTEVSDVRRSELGEEDVLAALDEVAVDHHRAADAGLPEW